MTTTTVRVLDEADWALYRRVRLAALADAPEAFGSTLARESAFTDVRWRERLAGGGVFLAEGPEGPRGLAGVLRHGPEGAGHLTGHLVSMWVAPEARGTGTADQLVTFALDRASAWGLRAMSLDVATGNVAAERLYARHGFVRTDAEAGVEGGFVMEVRLRG
ncbi:GNAT family N-acetyltransferase [Streptomyces sp. NPDC048172]|uniref:GNAT family N-acetyltransferase n=1 Tax=Streptomyces sp. NPDC048172 TaxID=3365505 RepID=UPI003720ED5C